MDENLTHIVAVVEIFVVPLIVFLMQRGLSKKLDSFDEKRESARHATEVHDVAMERGMRSLLRSELIHEHRKWTENGYCPLESKEYVQHTYEAYHNLGGNDIGTSMYNELMALPIAEKEA